MPETSCIKETSAHIKNMCIKQLGSHKVRDFGGLSNLKTFRDIREMGP